MEVNCPHCGKSTSLGEVYPVAAPPSPSVIPSSRPQLPPSKAKPDNAVLFNVQWVASVIAGVLVLCNVAAEKWKQRKVAARAESAAVSPPTPIPDYSEEIMALLKPETRRLPKDFTTQWNGDGSGTKAAMDAARQAQAGKLFALVLETKYTRALPLQPEIPGFGLIAATLQWSLRDSSLHISNYGRMGFGFPRRWVLDRGGQPVTYFRAAQKSPFLNAMFDLIVALRAGNPNGGVQESLDYLLHFAKRVKAGMRESIRLIEL